ncbi:hypothetical protein H5V45_11945 [Nocardioides sp. KIGAM211]|uniref:TIGR02569 family protein n=1 Tax=Nocardioides luti TaxID=2761101 RepID=A0A7X0RH33_9ACTN|nr:hypothetical protein [Nocardioides luti]MBB6628030.1 hypothetical protein [Nocardioides luti]
MTVLEAPPLHVLRAYGLAGEPVLLPGGQGRAYRVGDAVVRHGDDAAVDAWLARVQRDVVEDGFRVARPLPARDWRCDDGWTVDGWSAWGWLPGVHRTTGADWPAGVEVARRFTAALARVPRPSFTDTRADVFADADRIAWGELAVPGVGDAAELVAELVGQARPDHAPRQVVHGDIAGNLLWADGLPPAVIDLSPSWRPAGLAPAQVVVDAVLWYGADASLADELDGPDPASLVARALAFRLAIHALMEAGHADVLRWDPAQVERDLARVRPLVERLRSGF